MQALAEGQTEKDYFAVQVADGQGGFDVETITINVNGTNDLPVAAADVASISEDATPVNGNLFTNDTDVDTRDTHTITALNGATDNGTTLTKVGTYGTLVVTKATGAYTYTLANGQANVQALEFGQPPVTEVFTYTNSDNHSGSSSATLTVSIFRLNDAPAVTPAAATVSEEGLSNGVADTLPAEFDMTNNATRSGTITASDAEGDSLTMTFGIPTGSLTSGGVTIEWTRQDNDHTLIGKAGETTIVRATITNAGAYEVTLSGPIDHSTANRRIPRHSPSRSPSSTASRSRRARCRSPSRTTARRPKRSRCWSILRATPT